VTQLRVAALMADALAALQCGDCIYTVEKWISDHGYQRTDDQTVGVYKLSYLIKPGVLGFRRNALARGCAFLQCDFPSVFCRRRCNVPNREAVAYACSGFDRMNVY
jgi:hypothetical protein